MAILTRANFVQPQQLTTAQRNALSLTTTDRGLVIFNLTVNGLEYWNGTAWLGLSATVPAATETVAGISRLATQGEVDAGVSTNTIVTPLKLANAVLRCGTY